MSIKQLIKTFSLISLISIFSLAAIPSNGSIIIDGGVAYNNTGTVTLTLAADGIPTEMRIGNTSGGGSFEPFNTTKVGWALDTGGGDGTKTVYVTFRNGEGSSGEVSDNIVYDAAAPGLSGTLSNVTWTNVSDPANQDFANATDTGPAGVDHYEIYWGTDSGAIVKNEADSNTSDFDPADLAGVDGTYYLRVRAIDAASNEGSWVTVMSYQFDDNSPTVPGTLSNITWTSASDPADQDFAEASDTGGSGINASGYEIYWGTDSNGTTATKTGSSDYDPADLGVGYNTYYLRARSKDNAGNYSAWQTIMTYQYDAAAPGLAGTLSNVTWTNASDPANQDFANATDTGPAGVDHYEIYWGTDSGAIIKNEADSATSAYDPADLAGVDGTYYLRVRAIDAASNAGNWVTVMSYQYENEAPGLAGTLSNVTWTNVSNPSNQNFADASDTGGSGVDHYEIYWGTNSGAIVKNQADSATSAYDPVDLAGADGTYYLRVRAIDAASNVGSWVTVMSYQFDSATKPISQLSVQSWTSDNTPGNITWIAPETEDTDDSGVNEYDLYWGELDDGESVHWTQSGETKDPGAIAVGSDGTWYLRARYRDNAGNESIWYTIKEYQFDDGSVAAPAISSVKTSSDGLVIGEFTWQTDNDPYVSWTVPAVNLDRAPITEYRIQWDAAGWHNTAGLSYTFNPDDISNGRHTINVQAKNQSLVWGDIVTFGIWVDEIGRASCRERV